MKRKAISLLLTVFIYSVLAYSSESDDPMPTDSAALLISTHYTSRIENGDSIIYIYFNFNDSIPSYFYEISHKNKKIEFTFNNARFSIFSKDDTVRQVNLGPIKSMRFKEQIKDMNETVKMLNQDLYKLITVSISCDPVVKDAKSIDVVEENKTVSMTLRWPSNVTERKAMYQFEVKRRPAVTISLAGLGTAAIAGGGYLLYKFLFSDSKNTQQPLDVVLPQHPSGL
jgi:hypothetical protein